MNYSRVFLPITYVLAYTAQFAGLSALVTHTVCWHGKDIWEQTRQSIVESSRKTEAEYRPVSQENSGILDRKKLSDDPAAPEMSGQDVHSRLMKRYDDAPLSWYLMTFVAMLAIGIFVVE